MVVGVLTLTHGLWDDSIVPIPVLPAAGGSHGAFRIILAILLPPVGVFLTVGFGLHFWLNILLTLLGYIPGLVHAIWIIARAK